MAGFTKLFGSIVTSTIWQEDPETKVIWITLLALVEDASGFVSATIPGLAHIAGVPLKKTIEAMAKFQEPDQYSRSKEHEGRRIQEVEGGWLILNYAVYRKVRDPEKRREQNRKAQDTFRQKQRADKSKPIVSQDKPNKAQAEAEADKDISPTSTDVRLAELLFSLIRERKPDYKKPDLKNWAKVINLTRRLDKREPERIEAVIRWVQADCGNGNGDKWRGWQNNILSAVKLRKKFDTLELKMQESKPEAVHNDSMAELIAERKEYREKERQRVNCG